MQTEFCQGKCRLALCEAELALPHRLARDRPRLRNLIVDFATARPAGFDSARFVDFYHLDSLGAALLSQALADTLYQQGYGSTKASLP